MKNFKQITDNRCNECPINDDLEKTLYDDAMERKRYRVSFMGPLGPDLYLW